MLFVQTLGTSLLAASYNGKVEVVSVLLEAGADVNYQANDQVSIRTNYLFVYEVETS